MTRDASQPARTAMTIGSLLIALVVILAVAAGVLVVLWGSPGRPTDDIYNYDSVLVPQVPASLIHYRQAAEVPAKFAELRALAIDRASQRLFVAGDRGVLVFDGPEEAWTKAKPREIRLDDEPRCLAAGSDGVLYVGLKEHVELYDARGKRQARWDSLGPKAALRSIAVSSSGPDVFAADGGNSWVVHFNREGKVAGYIGRDDQTGKPNRFRVETLQCFDLAMGGDDQLRVVDPQTHRIETYGLGGALMSQWGERPTQGVAAFHGCCNPTDIAVMPDGSVVACEKGARLSRIKLYDQNGNLLSVVAPPGSFVGDSDRLDVAVDAQGRIAAIDPSRKCVRIFERKPAASKPAGP